MEIMLRGFKCVLRFLVGKNGGNDGGVIFAEMVAGSFPGLKEDMSF